MTRTQQDPKTKKIEYSFGTEITRKSTKEEKRTENGEEIVIKKEIEEILPVRIIFYRPTRKQKDEADIVFAQKLYELMGKGIMTKQQIAKVYNNDGGDLSKPEAETYFKLNIDLTNKLRDIEYLSRKELSEDEKKKYVEMAADVALLRRELVEFESQRSAIFDHCADQKAFYHALAWYVVNCSYKEIEGQIYPIFPGDSFEAKLDKYDELVESEDELISKIKNKLNSLIAYWYTAQPKTAEEWHPIEEELGLK